LRRFEKEKRGGSYHRLHAALLLLPLPGKVDQRGISFSDAIEAGMLQQMDEVEAQHFTPTEVVLYQHAQDWRYISCITIISTLLLIIRYVHSVGLCKSYGR
jgi:hypothetical protein